MAAASELDGAPGDPGGLERSGGADDAEPTKSAKPTPAQEKKFEEWWKRNCATYNDCMVDTAPRAFKAPRPLLVQEHNPGKEKRRVCMASEEDMARFALYFNSWKTREGANIKVNASLTLIWDTDSDSQSAPTAYAANGADQLLRIRSGYDQNLASPWTVHAIGFREIGGLLFFTGTNTSHVKRLFPEEFEMFESRNPNVASRHFVMYECSRAIAQICFASKRGHLVAALAPHCSNSFDSPEVQEGIEWFTAA